MDNQPRINTKAIFVGLLALLGFFAAIYFTNRDKYIREKGTVIKVPIVELSSPYSKTSPVYVLIEGKKVYAGQFKGEEYSIGDSIKVCYILGEYCVVQKGVSLKRFYLYYAFESLLLLVGLYLIIGGLRGKGTISNKNNVE
jgi:hypothetical protein